MTLKSRSRSPIIELVRDLANMHLWYDFERNTDGRTDGRTDEHINLIGGFVTRNPPKNESEVHEMVAQWPKAYMYHFYI